MKRREFISSAGAVAVLPVMPLPALASSPVATAPVNAAQVGWAALFARVNDRATPALLQKWMGVGPQQADALMSELVKRNIIHTPVAGSAVSVQPMYPNGPIPKVARASGDFLRKSLDALHKLGDPDDPAAIDPPDEEHPDETA